MKSDRKWLKWIALLFAVVLGAAVILSRDSIMQLWLRTNSALTNTGAMDCPLRHELSESTGSRLITGKKNDSTPATLVLQKGQTTSLAFGRTLEAKELIVRLDVAEGKARNIRKPLNASASFFKRGDDARVPQDLVRVTADFQGPKEVHVRLCIDRNPESADAGSGRNNASAAASASDSQYPASAATDPNGTSIKAGSYEGTITVLDPRVSKFSIPVTATFSYPNVALAPGITLIVVMFIGSAYLYLLGRPDKSQESEDEVLSIHSARQFGRWLRTSSGVFAVVAGGIAAVTAFFATYMQAVDWGSSGSQFLSLFGAMFTAFVAAGTAARVVNRKPSSEGTVSLGDKSREQPQPLAESQRG
jgi:hypothetical protein